MKQNKQEQWEKNLDMYWRKSFLSNVSDVNGRDYDSLKQFISDLISQTRQEAVEEVLGKLDKAVEKKFPRGERQWCVDCSKRIRRYVLGKKLKALSQEKK